jgi:hypothetical protein
MASEVTVTIVIVIAVTNMSLSAALLLILHPACCLTMARLLKPLDTEVAFEH